MKYNTAVETLEEGLGISLERASELNAHMNVAFDTLVKGGKTFTTHDIVSMVCVEAVTAPEAFYVAWATRGVLSNYANAQTS